ncbi:MAG: 2-hydroxyacyl-CoA dehydratase [Chloroflexi bacterium]|nr:2-hydroxyacyl-CoA dehydratase [Chloroflexota bacterium]
MERFHQLLEAHHQYAEDWKARTGRKVMGYMCTYFPEELVYAAGALPIRVLSIHEPDDVTARYMYNAWCPASRDIFLQRLKGKYDYLDGIGDGSCCEHLRTTFANWRLHAPTPYDYFVSVPAYADGPHAKTLLRKELAFFKTSLEEWTGNTITEQALDHAIEVYNTNRRLMRQIYELRRADNPPLSGAEAMAMVLCSQTMDKEEHNRLLMDVIRKLPQRKASSDPGVRLMLLGSGIDSPELVRLIESLGATIVIDELCSGSSYFWNEVIPQEDRLLAIALRYLDKPRCPLKDIRYRHRTAHISDLLEAYNARGVIIAQQRLCHPFQFDNPVVMAALRQRHIPFHFMEHDNTIPYGESRIRIEAFVQMLQPQLV